MGAHMRGQAVHRLSIEMHAALFVLQRAADAIDQRTFARPVGPDQSEPLARLHLKIDTVERDEAAKAFAQVLHLQ